MFELCPVTYQLFAGPLDAVQHLALSVSEENLYDLHRRLLSPSHKVVLRTESSIEAEVILLPCLEDHPVETEIGNSEESLRFILKNLEILGIIFIKRLCT